MDGSAMNFVPPTGEDYFWRRAWHEEWHYPTTGTLIQIYNTFPILRGLYLRLEKNFDPVPVITWSRRNYYLGPTFVAIYLLAIFAGQRYMKNRPAYNLRKQLAIWNGFLALFSVLGAIRVVPHLLLLLYTIRLQNTLCAPAVWSYGSGAVGLWTVLFVYSKYLELIDTAFIVLRKKPLNFLHWYHHATVLLYAWDGYVNEQPVGLHFAAMNYFVHSVMYSYYFVAALRTKPPSWGMSVTVLQVAQMIAGTSLCCLAAYLGFKLPFMHFSTPANALDPLSVPACYVSRYNLVTALLMYTTYFYLFLKFFLDRYIFRKATRSRPSAVSPVKKKA